MKTSTYVLLALILITILVNGCKKSELATAPKNKMAAASLNSSGSGLIKLTEVLSVSARIIRCN